MKGVILAAGKGTRLGEIGSLTSKPALPLMGKTLLERVYEIFVDHFDSIVIVINPQDRLTKKILEDKDWKRTQVEVVEQTQPLGSADALRQAWPYVEDACVVTGCDNIVQTTFIADLCTQFKRRKPDALVALYAIERVLGSPGSVVETDHNDRITTIIEKPRPGELLSDQMALPLYAFQKDFYQDLVSIELSERNEFEIPSAIQHLIERGGVVMGTESSWRMTINTPEEYLAAVREMLLMDKKAHREPPHELNPGTNIRKPVHIEDSVFIGEGATIGPCAYLMEGSSIGYGARVRDS
ncbi:MAG: NDP-sugar synthase, partial [Anaerolineales bacterium]